MLRREESASQTGSGDESSYTTFYHNPGYCAFYRGDRSLLANSAAQT